jgi:hypothetical protein
MPTKNTSNYYVPNLAFGIANLMPTPENWREWQAGFENISHELPSNFSDARKEYIIKEIQNFMLGLATSTIIQKAVKRNYIIISRKCLSNDIEEPVAVACKALGWRIKIINQKNFKLFPYKANTQNDSKRIATQSNYKKYRQEIFELQEKALSMTES